MSERVIRTDAELQILLAELDSVPRGSAIWSVRASEALDLLIPSLREAWADRTVASYEDAEKMPLRHRLDTCCGSRDCNHRWRIEPDQARFGCLLTCPQCGSRTRIIDVTEYYIRTTWPA